MTTSRIKKTVGASYLQRQNDSITRFALNIRSRLQRLTVMERPRYKFAYHPRLLCCVVKDERSSFILAYLSPPSSRGVVEIELVSLYAHLPLQVYAGRPRLMGSLFVYCGTVEIFSASHAFAVHQRLVYFMWGITGSP